MSDSQPIPNSQTPAQTDADAESAAVADLGHPYRWIILLGLVTAAIMEILDTTIINVALPRMMSSLDATTDLIGWVSTGYILSNVIVLPMTAWLSGRFGRKLYLGGSVLLFIFASLMCGLARSLDELVFWRIVQGAGGAALISTAQATLVEIFPKSKMGMVQAIFGMGLLVAPTIGPALGGWITDHYSWNWCFFINVPIGLISAVIIALYLPNIRQAHASGSIDWPGIGLLAVGLGSLQYVLSEGRRFHWFASGAISRPSRPGRRRTGRLRGLGIAPRQRAPHRQPARPRQPRPGRRLHHRRRARRRPLRGHVSLPALCRKRPRLLARPHRRSARPRRNRQRHRHDLVRTLDRARPRPPRLYRLRHPDVRRRHLAARACPARNWPAHPRLDSRPARPRPRLHVRPDHRRRLLRTSRAATSPRARRSSTWPASSAAPWESPS